MKHKILALIIFVISVISTQGQTSISGIINTYAKVDSIQFCSNTVYVTSVAGFSVGDRVLLIEMKGADVNLTNTASFGNLNAYNNAGNYEFGNIDAISGTGIQLVNALSRSYTATAAVQLIRVPVYVSASVDGLLTAQDWNGTTGGVLVFESNTLSLNADIDVSGKGFKGGDAGNFPSSCPTGTGTSLYYSDTLSGKGGEKGEGIVVLANGYLACRGKAVNGGGGGNDHNGGAAGGSNGSTGGIGGNNDEPVFSCPGNPGLAAIALDQTSITNKLFLGGGGGAGHGNNTNGTSGGDGGGLVIIKSASIDGNSHSIISNGITVTDLAWGDGAGGGGAGGSIVINATSVVETSFVAKGGKGGDTGADQCTGPGGGGSGGVVKFSGATLWPGISTDLSGGTFGTNTTTTSSCFGLNNGAGAGAAGITVGSLSLAEGLVPFNPDFANAGSDVQVCPGGSVMLNASGGVSYLWSPTVGLDNPTIANPVCTPPADMNYTVTVTSVNGCTDNDVVHVDVLPAVAADAGPDISVCAGSSATLHATGGVAYLWSPATFLDNPAIADPIVTPLTDMTYTVTVTDANGCTGTDAVLVHINNADFLTTGPDVSVCAGGSVTLTASGATTYAWTPSTYLDDAISASPVCTPATDITYMVIGQSGAGCFDTSYVTVNVTSEDFLSVVSDISICSGGSSNLYASGGTTYLWSPSTYLDDPASATPLCTPSFDMTYIVTSINAGGCTDIDTVHVTVASSDFLVTASSVMVCHGDAVVLNASGATTYLWSPSTYLDDPTSPTPLCTPLAPIIYTVTGTNGGCTDTKFVSVGLYPEVIPNAGPDTTICSGGQFKLHAEGGITYSWTPSTYLDAPVIAEPTCNPMGSITYIVYVTDANGCVGTDTVDIIVNPAPVITASDDITICRGDTVTLTATGGDTYTWTPEPIGGATGSSIDVAPSTTTSYSVMGTDANGCVGYDDVLVTVEICNSIEDILAEQIKIYPNPASDFIQIGLPDAMHHVRMEIYNVHGESISALVEKNNSGYIIYPGQISPQQIFIHIISDEGDIMKMVTLVR